VWHDAWVCEIRSKFILSTANVTFIYFVDIFEGAEEQIGAENNRRQERNREEQEKT
jgi:hypothetical protein